MAEPIFQHNDHERLLEIPHDREYNEETDGRKQSEMP